ncbi:MFS transporter [Veronia pacifica]|uniref:Major facilitator superfamily (MFS) profile domain-containing protein n=1 Tax=Veronia pacifica TaxID=1080227 RepID=A0A1C3E7Y3_9GAMM|nr:MFS transporter [Veronia pacifica]ODA29346.1 hypothetical protein A8L45_22385 [Veronia pacifica]
MSEKLLFARSFGLHQGWLLGSFNLMLPILPVWLMSWGLTPSEMAMGYVTMGAMVVITEVPFGILADKIGQLTVYILGIILVKAAILVWLLSPNLIGCVVGFALWGIGLAMNSGTLGAWFVEAFRKKEGTEPLQPGFAKMGQYCSCLSAGTALFAAAVTGFWLLFPQWSLPLESLVTLSLISLLFHAVFTVIWLRGKVSDEVINQEPQPLNDSDSFGQLARHPVIWRLLILATLLTPMFGAVEKFWPVMFEPLLQNDWPDISLTSDVAWVFFLSFSIVSFGNSVAHPLMTRLCNKLDRQLGKAVYIVYVIQCLSLIAMAFAPNWWCFLPAWLAFYVGFSVKMSAEGELFNDCIPDDKRASMMSLHSLFTRLGGIGGSITIGVGTLYLSINSVFILLAGFSLFAVHLYLDRQLNRIAQPTEEVAI